MEAISAKFYHEIRNDVETMHDPGGSTIQTIHDHDFLVMREENDANVWMDGVFLGCMPIPYVTVCICSPDPAHALAVYEDTVGGG